MKALSVCVRSDKIAKKTACKAFYYARYIKITAKYVGRHELQKMRGFKHAKNYTVARELSDKRARAVSK